MDTETKQPEVIIKQNAFAGSDDPKQIAWRGKRGRILAKAGDGVYKVYVPGKGTRILYEDEIEMVT